MLADWESPAGNPDSSASLDFTRQRAAAGFEDVMVYYHLDTMQRWYRSLGFTDANARAQVADAHGAYGADNSKFVPSTHKIAYGEGGVDDAEDAGVIVHEYGHATQFDIVPTWGTGGHTAPWARVSGITSPTRMRGRCSRRGSSSGTGVFQWDGHNEYWAGRPAMDPSLHYPEDASGNIYRGGTSGARRSPKRCTDSRSPGDGSSRPRPSLRADRHSDDGGRRERNPGADVAFYQGAHLPVLVEVFGRWGLVDATAWMPIAIELAPLDIAPRRSRGPPHGPGRGQPAPVAPARSWPACVLLGTPWSGLPMVLAGGEYTATLRLPCWRCDRSRVLRGSA